MALTDDLKAVACACKLPPTDCHPDCPHRPVDEGERERIEHLIFPILVHGAAMPYAQCQVLAKKIAAALDPLLAKLKAGEEELLQADNRLNDQSRELAEARKHTNSEYHARKRAEVRAESLQAGGWSWDLSKLPSEPIEVAFDGGMGMCNVRICSVKLLGPGSVNGNAVQSPLERGYFEEARPDINIAGTGWRPYAWRRIQIPARAVLTDGGEA